MSSTLLEQARGAHDDIERLERLVVKELQKEVKTHKERLNQSHRVKMMVDAISAATARLVDIYEDNDGARSEELAALGGQTAPGQNNVFSAFYDRLKEIREYHRRHPSAQMVEDGDGLEEMMNVEPAVEFSGEEGYGRFLDLHELFQLYINSKFGKLLEYNVYLEEFSKPHQLPRTHKLTKQYTEYLQELLLYLVSFFQRTQPLHDLERIFSKVESEFEEKWAAGQIEGWEDKACKPAASVNLDEFHSPEELEQLGNDMLKEMLTSLGMKSGGTIKERTQRLWLTKFQPLDQIDGKHFVKGMKPKKSANAGSQQSIKDIALSECKIRRLCELLQEAIQETKSNLEKKQSLTYAEIEEEREEEEVQPESESEEEEQPVYNPLNVPEGWDGKPIPYWLYKLHGLGQEFTCEICGNQSYRGRRAFERHFKESQHQRGMRCLGIPNNKNFHEITSIKDAKELWEKIKERQGTNNWQPDLEEEYEDRDGNVYNKKTFRDLQRQGLI